MSNLFPNKCGISVAANAGYRFISDCQVLPAPLAIWDAPAIEIFPDVPPPPSVDVPIACPTPKIAGMNSIGFDVCVDPKLLAQVQAAGDNCAFVFDITLLLPAQECVLMSLPPLSTQTRPVFCGAPICDIQMIPELLDPCGEVCQIVFDTETRLDLPATVCTFIDLNFACNTQMGARCGTPSATIAMTAESQDSCAAECNMAANVVLDLVLPKPACAGMGINFNMAIDYDGQCSEPIVVISTDTPDPCDGPNCNYTADITVLLPRMEYSIPGPRHGMTGPTGPPGDQGEPGAPGLNGRDGRNGTSGRSGINGAPGTPGENESHSGATGPPGKAGPTGPEGPWHPFAKPGNPGPDGPCLPGGRGPRGNAGAPCEEEKPCIIPVFHNGEFLNVALFCTEMPEVRFEDLLAIPCYDGTGIGTIDERFRQACEPESITVASLLPDRAVFAGAAVVGQTVRVRVADKEQTTVNVLLSGIRRGYRGIRFREVTEARALANKRFWAKAREA